MNFICVLLFFYAFTICAMNPFDRRLKNTSSEQFDLAKQVKKHQEEIEMGIKLCLVILEKLEKTEKIFPILINIIEREEERNSSIKDIQKNYTLLSISLNVLQEKIDSLSLFKANQDKKADLEYDKKFNSAQNQWYLAGMLFVAVIWYQQCQINQLKKLLLK
ncbi:hypothetical protein EKK58_04065 [Candidatus Dependentiae bacterium]|nr:MAG: hypothetical protein EKK58_04065 [Candidatus Dependentiae bacterium]